MLIEIDLILCTYSLVHVHVIDFFKGWPNMTPVQGLGRPLWRILLRETNTTELVHNIQK